MGLKIGPLGCNLNEFGFFNFLAVAPDITELTKTWLMESGTNIELQLPGYPSIATETQQKARRRSAVSPFTSKSNFFAKDLTLNPKSKTQ